MRRHTVTARRKSSFAKNLCLALLIVFFTFIRASGNFFLLIAFFAFEFRAQFLAPSVFAQNPLSRNEWRFMAQALVMPTFQFRPPIVFVVLVVADDFTFHFLRRKVGFHHRKIVKAISQHTPEATTRGRSCLNSRARAASTVADKIHNCARFIITNKTSRACQTAVRPRSIGRRRV